MTKKPPSTPKNKIKDRLKKAGKVELRVVEGGVSAEVGTGSQPSGARNKDRNEVAGRHTDKLSKKGESSRAEKPESRDFDLYGAPAPPPSGDDRPPNDLSPKEVELVRKCADLDQNDRDNGRRLVIWFGDDLVYVSGMGWLTWRGTHWQRDEGELQARLKAQNLVDKIKIEVFFIEPTTAQQFLLDAADRAAKKPSDDQTKEDLALISKAAKAHDQLRKKKTARRTFAVSSGNSAKTVAMLAQAASLMAIDQDNLDADHMALNVQNGTLKIAKVRDPDGIVEDQQGGGAGVGSEATDGGAKKIPYTAEIKFEDHQRSDLITKRADVIYDPDATCPDFMKFLAQVQPDQIMQLLLQVFHGYAMLAGNDEQKIIFHYGSGANGKSVFIETLGRLLGQYRAVVSPDTMTGDGARGGQQASPDIARLFNARVATIEELPRGSPLKENLIKSISGGTKMVARFLLKEMFEFDPLFTAVMSGNDMPEVSGTDHGIWRRLLLVHWAVTIPDADQVAFGTMLERFDKERSGILNWLLDGIRLYLENGLNKYIPASVAKFADEYRSDKDPVGEFVKACVNRMPDTAVPRHKVQAKDMLKAYQDWSEFNAIKAWQQTAFGRRMNALGFTKDRKRVVFYLDCELHDVPDPAPDPQRGFYDR